MSSYEECQDAVEILSDYTEAHRIRARKIGGIGIELLSQNDAGEKDFGLSVGLHKGPLPPKYAATINLLLEEYGLEVPVRYSRVGKAYAN